jgi:hypothetical protein
MVAVAAAVSASPDLVAWLRHQQRSIERTAPYFDEAVDQHHDLCLPETVALEEVVVVVPAVASQVISRKQQAVSVAVV